MQVWEAVLLGSALLGVLLVVGYSLRAGISPMPSGRVVRATLLALVDPEQRGRVVDLGSGWGSLVVPLARRCPQATVEGLELSPLPWLVSWLWVRWRRLPNVRVRRVDFFQESMEEATLVVCYLYTGAMKRLSRKLQEELPPGARVLSHTFALPGWTPSRVVRANDLYRTPIYMYDVPASCPPKSILEPPAP